MLSTHTRIALGLATFIMINLFVAPSTASAQTVQLSQCTDAQLAAGWVPDAIFMGGAAEAVPTAICRPPNTLGESVNPVTGSTTPLGDPKSCSGIVNFWSKPITCLGRSISAVIGSALITITAWLLQIVGQLFNWLMYYTVIAFGDQTNGFLTTGVLDAINKVWTVFRDLANILIIGLFVFIAISIILNLKEYGAKKLIARALIIAVLINFSLLFTKMIIDGSNFVAYQLYTAAQVGGRPASSDVASAAQAVTGGSFSQDGVAGQFIKFMGITSISNTFSTLSDGADAINNGWITLLHGLFGATLLLAAAGVLLYGSFLLASRAILMIFLLITSSLAFATYLIPKLSDGEYGWGAWWKSLLSNAVFAPMLVLMLWATLKFAQALQPKGGTLGALLTDPSNAGNLSALFSYVIILGLLFGSFKIASSFSSKIGGFNFAAMVPALGLAAGARVAAFAGRQTIGRPALAISERMQKASQDTSKSTFARNLYDFGSQRFKGLAKRDFDAMRTGLGGVVAGAANLKADQLAGKKLGGFLGQQEKLAHDVAEKARRMTAKDSDQAAKQAEIVGREVAKSVTLSAEHADSKQYHEASQENVKRTQEGLAKMSEQHNKEMGELQKELAETRRLAAVGTRTKDDVDAVERKITVRKAEQLEEMNKQTQRIKDAREMVTAAAGRIADVQRRGREIAEAKGILPEEETAAHVAGDLVRNSLMRKFYTSGENDRLVHLSEHEVKHQLKKKKLKDEGLYDAFKEIAQEGGHGAPAPAAPAQATGHEPEPQSGDHGEHN